METAWARASRAYQGHQVTAMARAACDALGVSTAASATGQQEGGEGEEHVGDPHEQRVGRTADIAGHQADAEADDPGPRDDEQGDAEGDPAPVQDAAEDVPADGVGAEPVVR